MIFQNFYTIYCVKVLKNHGPQCDHRGFLQDIYVPINENFQEPLSMESTLKKKLYLHI